MIQERETFNRFSSIHTKPKKTTAEISKSVAHAVAIELANVCCKNTVGDVRADRSCRSQDQGAIDPAIANSRYKDFIEPNEPVVDT